MKVTPLDRLTFLVTSESMPDTDYLVDLEEGNGECVCLDFIGRRKKKLKATCKHIRRCFKYLAEEKIKELREQSND